MSEDLASDILEGLVPPAEAPKVAEVTPAVTPAPDIPAQASQPVPAAPAAVAPAEVTPPKQDHTVPLPTFLDMRDQLKAAKARLAEVEARPAPQVPSAANDPEAFAKYQADLVNSTRTNTVFDMSEVMAREKHGDEPVTAAMTWAMERASTSPAFAAEYLQQKHPIDWAVKQQKRHALMTEIGDDLDGFIARKVAEKSAAAPAQPVTPAVVPASPQPAAQPAPVQPSPTRSLASAPTAGSATSVPAHPVAAIDAVFR